MDRSTVAGLTAGLGAVLIWGGWAVTSRSGVLGGLDVLDMTALRYIVAGVILLPVLRGVAITGSGIGGVSWRTAFWLYFGAGVPYSLLVYTGFDLAPVGHQAVIHPSGILLLTCLLGVILIGERIGRLQSLGIALIVLGVTTVGWESLVATDGTEWLGDLCFLASALLWAIFTVAARGARVPPLMGAAIVSVLSMVTLAPVYLAIAGLRLFTMPLTEVLLQAIYQGVLAGVVSLILFSRAVMLLGAARASIFAAFTPGFTILLAIPVLGEWPTTLSLAGLALALIGMVVAITAGTRAAKAPPGTR